LEKSSSAFRTISEVAAELSVPKHVLRFWEGKFPQLRPMKRGGGRRYYRPEDIELLRGIRWLLYSDGYTIKGVQRILRDNGVKFVKLCWRDQAAEPSFDIPNLAAEAASAARRPGRGAERSIPSAMPVQAGRAKTMAEPPAAQAGAFTKDQRDFLQSLIGNLEECRSLLQASIEQQESAGRKARTGRRSASGN
jgi:DNA-binding transcriptional MerR regulator